MDFNTMSNEELTAALTDTREKAKALFALDTPTVEQADEAKTLMETKAAIEQVQAKRAEDLKQAAADFAAAKEAFSEAAPEDDSDDADDAEGEDGDADGDADDAADDVAGESVEASAEGGEDDGADDGAGEQDGDADSGDTDNDDGGDAGSEEGVNASVDHSKTQTFKPSRSTAKKVARRNARPNVDRTQPVVITAAADIPNVPTGAVLDGMENVTKALQGRMKGFPKFNSGAAKATRMANGGVEELHHAAVASFGLQFDDALVASGGPNGEYAAIQRALKQEGRWVDPNEAMVAAGWCAPSENVYTYIADYVVDGLLTLPEVSAPRGGINITTGPARSSQGEALDEFGFVQTEAQAEAGEVKTCETIVCPPFEDHRLDAIGYCFKIPILTQKAYPELVTDALRFASVLYAHKVNARLISDIVGLSDDVTFSGYGPSLTDTLEALSIIATKERRKWNVGENAVMEVKVPVIGREVFRADMSRRTGLALSDVATDQKIAAEFTARKLAVEYVSDWQELPDNGTASLPGFFDVVMYPKGTFVKAVEDVINLSAVYDAASLSVNEYTGVFFEQGLLVAKVGYGSSKVRIGINTAGETGAAILQGLGDAVAAGSF